MTRKNKQATQDRVADVRRSGWWVVSVILLALIVVESCWLLDKSTAAAGPDPSKLIGQWLRSDGGYALVLSDLSQDGQLKAAYFNPRSVYVSRSEWKSQDGRLSAFVELSDVHYPGSTYTLDYSPATDRLVGIYFQAAMRQQFEVEFIRREKQE